MFALLRLMICRQSSLLFSTMTLILRRSRRKQQDKLSGPHLSRGNECEYAEIVALCGPGRVRTCRCLRDSSNSRNHGGIPLVELRSSMRVAPNKNSESTKRWVKLSPSLDTMTSSVQQQR